MDHYFSYNFEINCKSCHRNCLTCFDNGLSSCLSCDLENSFRILNSKLSCNCISGYYEDNDLNC